jgi:DNA-binding transcriptional LysR family regulator
MTNELDPALRTFSYESLEMLILFEEHGTFARVAQIVGSQERAVRRQLHAMTDEVAGRTGTVIIREKNQRRSELTAAGKELVNHARRITTEMKIAVRSVEGGQVIPLITTSNGCKFVAELAEQDRFMRSDRDPKYRIAPTLVHSSEITFDSIPEDVEFALFSKLVATTVVPIEIGIETPIEGGWMLPLKVDDLMVLTNHPLPGPPYPRPAEIIDAGVTLCSPAGGVAWDFVQKDWPNWHLMRDRQYFHVPNLFGGVQVLESGLAGGNAAMIVHGLTRSDPRLHAIDNPVLDPLHNDPQNNNWKAVTALFRAERPSSGPAHDLVWKHAKDLWAPSEGIR